MSKPPFAGIFRCGCHDGRLDTTYKELSVPLPTDEHAATERYCGECGTKVRVYPTGLVEVTGGRVRGLVSFAPATERAALAEKGTEA